MASFVLLDASLTINSIDLSDHVVSLTLTINNEVQDNTAMGDTFRSRLAGLNDWSADVTMLQDYASASVDATLHPLIGAAAFAVVILPTSDSASPTNPSYTGNALLENYPGIAGTLGETAQVSFTLRGAGTLLRATS